MITKYQTGFDLIAWCGDQHVFRSGDLTPLEQPEMPADPGATVDPNRPIGYCGECGLLSHMWSKPVDNPGNAEYELRRSLPNRNDENCFSCESDHEQHILVIQAERIYALCLSRLERTASD